MPTIRDHYAAHLAPIYLWMIGGFDNAMTTGKSDLEALGIRAAPGVVAMDLGAGFGMHAIPLARAGCAVTAVDESVILLDELRARGAGLPIRVIEGDILKVRHYVDTPPDIVLCMGDTLTHVQSKEEVEELFAQTSAILAPQGSFAMTFRDYSSAASGDRRFIPVRSDDSRIHTCFVEEEPTHMVIHDVVHERTGGTWSMKVSSYRKLRISADWAQNALRRAGLRPTLGAGPRGMVQIVARAV
jgi:hypothetical protein